MKNPIDGALLERIERFEIDARENPFRFADRLARENRWTKTYTLHVIQEYKRFMYLCCAAGHPVTPPVDVDEAWHLHLCYTQSYWTEFCGKVLGQPVHHGPTKGGAEEREKFVDWYSKTLESYRHHFGEEPPAHVWPSPEKRFATPSLRKVDPTRHFVIPRKVLPIGAGSAAVIFGLAGCTQFTGIDLLDLAYLSIIAIIFVALMMKAGGRGGGGGHGNSGGCGGSGDSWGGDGCSGCGGGGGCGGCGGG